MSHTDFQRRLQISLSRRGFRVFGNPVGYDATKRISYGLARGSADLIGWYPIADCYSEREGEPIGVFVAIEVKMPGDRLRKEQKSFIDAVERAGGFAYVARAATRNPNQTEADKVAEEILLACQSRYVRTP